MKEYYYFITTPMLNLGLIFISIFFFSATLSAMACPPLLSFQIQRLTSQSFVPLLLLASANIIFFMIVSSIQKLSVKRKDGDKDCCTFVHT